jgi:hypothetical protein
VRRDRVKSQTPQLIRCRGRNSNQPLPHPSSKVTACSSNTSFTCLNQGTVIASPLRRKPARPGPAGPAQVQGTSSRLATIFERVQLLAGCYANAFRTHLATTLLQPATGCLAGWLTGCHIWWRNVRLSVWMFYILPDQLTFWLPDTVRLAYMLSTWLTGCPNYALTESQSGLVAGWKLTKSSLSRKKCIAIWWRVAILPHALPNFVDGCPRTPPPPVILIHMVIIHSRPSPKHPRSCSATCC